MAIRYTFLKKLNATGTREAAKRSKIQRTKATIDIPTSIGKAAKATFLQRVAPHADTFAKK